MSARRTVYGASLPLACMANSSKIPEEHGRADPNSSRCLSPLERQLRRDYIAALWPSRRSQPPITPQCPLYLRASGIHIGTPPGLGGPDEGQPPSSSLSPKPLPPQSAVGAPRRRASATQIGRGGQGSVIRRATSRRKIERLCPFRRICRGLKKCKLTRNWR